AQPAGGLFLQPLRHHVRGAREDPPRASVQAAADPGEPGCARHQNRVMNKTLLLILCDFLLLNLLALTRWEKAEPARAKQPPVPQMNANAVTKDQDLVEAMKLSLADERATRTQLTQKLSTAVSTLAQRDQNLTQLQADQSKLAATLSATQRTAAELNQKYAAAAQDATTTKEELARIQRELEDKRAEAERQKQALAALAQQQTDARQKIEGLSVAVKV